MLSYVLAPVSNDSRVTFLPVDQTFKMARVINFTTIQKIGRADNDSKSGRSNLKFESKTVSRNHAIMWMAEGKVKKNSKISDNEVPLLIRNLTFFISNFAQYLVVYSRYEIIRRYIFERRKADGQEQTTE
jgi:hypothetical protein